MDLETECSALESVEENNAPNSVPHIDEIVIKNNGSCANDFDKLSSGEHDDSKSFQSDRGEQNVAIDQSENSPSMNTHSPQLPGGSPQTTLKGYGLKKWRRIRRDFVGDATPSLDSSKILKRGLSGSGNPNTKPLHLSPEGRQKSEGSVGSANMVAKNLGNVEYSPIERSSSGSRLAVGTLFAAGTDSENSEDRSSKSSTAASAPKVRYDTAALGNARDKNRMKSLSGKGLGNSPQRSQQGKARIETSKKPRGERVKIEKENSHSSMESDSRSSNFVFMQGVFSANSNGKQPGLATNYDGENSDEAQASEQQFSEDIQTCSKENVEEAEDLSQDDLAADLSWKEKEERTGNHRPSTDNDPLVDSILKLQSVQEALENELQKFGEIWKEPSFISAESESHQSPPFQLGSEDVRQSTSSSFETEVTSLTQKVISLECKLEESGAMLEAKESRVVELEATLHRRESPKGKSGSTNQLHQENFEEFEIQLEGLFKKKIEAEIEYLALVRTIQNLRVAAGEQVTLFEEQKNLAGEQIVMMNKLEAAKGRAEKLTKQAENLETYCGEILETEEVVKMQKKVFKVTWCVIIQLMLLVLVFGMFVLQFSPQSGEVVPT